MSYYLTYICIQITLTVSDCRSNMPWSTQVFQVTTKWFFSCIRQHPSFANQTGWWIHSFTINISYQQLDWRIKIFRPLENCPYQFYTKIHQPNRAERQSSDISSSSLIKSVQNINFTASNNRLLKCSRYTTNTNLDIAKITQLEPFSRNYMMISN